jgi:adenylate kinase
VLLGGNVLDFHSCDLFPRSWIDLVVVLSTNHTILWDRLLARNYPLTKIQENNESEIMQVVLEEAHESFPKDIILSLKSDTSEDITNNTNTIVEWVNKWKI